MFNTSLRDVLKENEKVTLDDSPIVDSIEDALGFIKENGNTDAFAQLRMKKDITDKEKSTIDLAEIFLPALALLRQERLWNTYIPMLKILEIIKNKEVVCNVGRGSVFKPTHTWGVDG